MTTTCTHIRVDSRLPWLDSRSMVIDSPDLSKWTLPLSIDSSTRWKLKCHLTCFNCSKPMTFPFWKPLSSRSAGLLIQSLLLAEISIPCSTSPTRTWSRKKKERPGRKRMKELSRNGKKETRAEFETRSKSGTPLKMTKSFLTPRKLCLWDDWAIKQLRKIWVSNSR